jgi:hypothetical protein
LTRPAYGDVTTDNEWKTINSEEEAKNNPDTIWTGPGEYSRRKFNATVPGGGSNTEWVRVTDGKVYKSGGEVVDDGPIRK